MTNQIEFLQNNIGFSYPITPTTVRHPMQDDGSAGEELPKGELGEICFAGPQIFLHYYDNEEATHKAISKEGILYTGDMGYLDDKGLHLSGRRKFIMKPKGYQVYPAEVEDHIIAKLKDKLEMVAVLGMPHEIFSEAIICYVEVKPGKTVTVAEIFKTTEDLAAYKRPSHVVILGPEEMPLNRTEKTDYMILRKIADKEIEKLRAAGKWDKAKIKT
jgi:acyl-CoA synthetase (AMP-forming)/AMP-acid ligase II